MAAFAEIIWNAGFDEIRFSDERYDTFSDAPSASSAAAFGTQGVNIWARKPVGARTMSSPTTVVNEPGSIHHSETPPGVTALPAPDDIFDAGALGCGDGPLLDIAKRLKAMQPGAVLEVRSTDPGVAADLPAWCRMVGHEFLGGGTAEYAGQYRVRRKQD